MEWLWLVYSTYYGPNVVYFEFWMAVSSKRLGEYTKIKMFLNYRETPQIQTNWG